MGHSKILSEIHEIFICLFFEAEMSCWKEEDQQDQRGD